MKKIKQQPNETEEKKITNFSRASNTNEVRIEKY